MSSSAAMKPTHVRYMVLFLAVVVYMITYIDRTFISTAIPVTQKELLFSDAVMGSILAAHQLGLWPVPDSRAAGWPTVSGRAGCWPRWCCGGADSWW